MRQRRVWRYDRALGAVVEVLPDVPAGRSFFWVDPNAAGFPTYLDQARALARSLGIPEHLLTGRDHG